MASGRRALWPLIWDRGARSVVEPFITAFFDVRLDGAWTWLYQHGQLACEPDLTYSPVTDAQQHLSAHVQSPCVDCAVWHLLLMLWSVGEELHKKSDAYELWSDAEASLVALRDLTNVTRKESPSEPVDAAVEALRVRLSRQLADLDDIAASALSLFTDETKSWIVMDRKAMRANRICKQLHDGGLSYAEVARVIGEHGEGAVDRVRMRCTRLR